MRTILFCILLAILISCGRSTETAIIKGDSLAPLLEPGTEIMYDATTPPIKVERGDIVIYNFTGNPEPIIKIVKAIPNDTWHLDGCHIIVNNKTLATKNRDGTDGAPYCIADTRRLQLYADDYPVIPPNTYLLMGNRPEGSLDGSVFGLIDGRDIIGVVIR